MKHNFLALGLVTTLAGCFGNISSITSSSPPVSSLSSVASSIASSSVVSSVSSVASSSSVISIISSSSPVVTTTSSSTSLVSVLPYSELMAIAMNTVMDATRMQMGLSVRLRTEEMNIELNPLLRVGLYQDEVDHIFHARYYNKIIQGLGLDAFEFFADFNNGMVYHNDSQQWGAETMDDFMTYTGLINVVQIEQFVDVGFILTTLREGFMDFETIDYLGAEVINGITADHYRVHIDLMDTFETIFNYLNANENIPDMDFVDFNAFLTQTNLTPIVPLFQNFVYESYLNADTDEVVRIALNLAHVLHTVVDLFELDLTAMVQQQFPEADVSILASYIEVFEIGINFYQVGTWPKPVIPQEAYDSYIPPEEPVV